MSQKTGDDLEDIPEDYFEFEEEGGGFDEEEAPTILYSEDFISRPILSENSELPEDIIDFDFSYSYDCKRFFNICCMEEDIVVFASGNLINFYNVVTKELWFRRSFLGGGIGHITRNPNRNYYHMAVAENGENPPIIIYEWPSLDIISVLKEGAAKRYAHINYSPDGELLASQSYGPDFLITIWNWKRSRIILRVKSHVIDVDRVKFSPYVPGHITTGGSGHIKFWKMAQTFTGLKLQGELGRFGKTEISDILGIFPMPDEKVLSGSEWGNILVWEAGLIKVEVFRTMRRKCHEKPIVHFEYINGELWTISMDGWCRAWNYKFIDDADPPDTDRIVQVVVSFERESPGVQFLSISKQDPYDEEHTMYYAQDGHGGIWLIDLALHTTYNPSVKLYESHAGAVVDIAASPWGPYLISLGIDGRIFFYNYLERRLLHKYQFPAKGRRMLWLPLNLDPSGSTLVMAFDDGVMRVVQVDIKNDDDISVKVIQTTKPHTSPITCFELNYPGNLLVTGSEDQTIFMFCIQYVAKIFTLVPIGYIKVPSKVNCLTWHPEQHNVIYVGCFYGELLEVIVPSGPQSYTEITYILHIEPKKQRFTTVKSQIRRDIKIREIEARKLKKLMKKKEELATIKANNPGLEIDEDQFLQDSESEEELEPLYFPEVPNRICFIMYTPENNLWLSMGGYDAGYIYEYTMDQKEETPAKSTIVYDADDIELHNYLYTHNKKYIIFTTHTGIIRLCRVDEDFRNLSDYWQLSMHDNYNGTVNRICFSYDSRFFFSCGNDGNVFSYKFNPEDEEYIDNEIVLEPIPEVKEVTVQDNYETLSLEQAKVKADYDKQMRLANEHKTKLRNRLKELEMELEEILITNCDLPRSQRIPLDQFILDQRIMDAFEESLKARVELEKRKIAHQLEKSTIGLQKLMDFFITPLDYYPFSVRSFDETIKCQTIHHRNLGIDYLVMEEIVQRKLIEELLKHNSEDVEEIKEEVTERKQIATEKRTKMRKRVGELEPFLVGLSPSTIAYKLGSRLSRMLLKYRQRKAAEERRAEEWQVMHANRPVDGVNHPDDEAALNIAKETIGDFKLKSADDYKVPKALKTSTVRKYDELLKCRKECFSIRNKFNEKLFNLRAKKVELIKYLQQKVTELVEIQSELPYSNIKPIPSVPEISPDDFPEKKYEVVIKLRVPEKKTKEIMQPREYVINDTDLIGDILRLPKIPGNISEICLSEGTKIKRLGKNINIDEFEGLKYGENDRTPWEVEFLIRRLISKIIEQDEIITDMNQRKEDFDQQLKKLRDERIAVLPKGTLSELHLLVLHQQVLIVKEFENAEDALLAVVEERTNDMMDMKDNMKEIENTIEQHHSDINQNNDKIKDCQQLFVNTAKDNKFWDFLRRIFRKKYKPPKIRDPDDTESSSSSDDDSEEESDEDDAGSLDSREIGPIRLDESVCPKGCDKELYDYTFSLRNERHGYERDIKEHMKAIEQLKKDFDNSNKKLKKFETSLQQSMDNLEEFQRERQKRLNEILCIVIMKFSQIKHLNIDGLQKKVLQNALVFSEPVYKKLYERVNELKVETLQQSAGHRKNKMHLHRMNIDCKSMENKVKQLKKKILDEMKLKFGSRVDLDELEEAILRRLVQELRVAMLNIRGEFEKELSTWTDTYGNKQIELKDIIRDNTARLQVYAIMSQEKSAMTHFLKLQSKKIDMVEKGDARPDEYFTGDLSKLKKVVEMQNQQIEELKNAIKSLTIKELPPPPIVYTPKEEKKEVSEFEEYDPSLEEIYIPPPHVQQQVEILQKVMKRETEDELQATVEEIIKEIITTHFDLSRVKSFEEGLKGAISSLVEQIPDEYLVHDESRRVITDTLKELHDGKSMINIENVMEQIGSPDHPHVVKMRKIVLDILQRSFDLYIYNPILRSSESVGKMNSGQSVVEKRSPSSSSTDTR